MSKFTKWLFMEPDNNDLFFVNIRETIQSIFKKHAKSKSTTPSKLDSKVNEERQEE